MTYDDTDVPETLKDLGIFWLKGIFVIMPAIYIFLFFFGKFLPEYISGAMGLFMLFIPFGLVMFTIKDIFNIFLSFIPYEVRSVILWSIYIGFAVFLLKIA